MAKARSKSNGSRSPAASAAPAMVPASPGAPTVADWSAIADQFSGGERGGGGGGGSSTGLVIKPEQLRTFPQLPGSAPPPPAPARPPPRRAPRGPPGGPPSPVWPRGGGGGGGGGGAVPPAWSSSPNSSAPSHSSPAPMTSRGTCCSRCSPST